MKINVVYRDMRENLLPAGESTGTVVTWSSRPLREQDVYFYVNSYSRPPGFTAEGLHFLYLSEPLCVSPDQYRRKVWRQFDAVYTWNPALKHPTFRHAKRPFCGFPHPVSWNQSGLTGDNPGWESRRPALCMINNNKRSLIEGELYSERVRSARWFHENGSMKCDVFGKIPFSLPSYRGVAPHGKLSTIQQYRFALCFENLYLDPWSRGYVTEKLFDCFAAGTVPVYLGAYDIEKYVPSDCFIDYRQFSSVAQLHNKLVSTSRTEWECMADSIRIFWKNENPISNWHWDSIYRDIETTAHVINRDPSGWRQLWKHPLPPDYPMSTSSLSNKTRFYLSCILVQHPRMVSLGLQLAARLQQLTARKMLN